MIQRAITIMQRASVKTPCFAAALLRNASAPGRITGALYRIAGAQVRGASALHRESAAHLSNCYAVRRGSTARIGSHGSPHHGSSVLRRDLWTLHRCYSPAVETHGALYAPDLYWPDLVLEGPRTMVFCHGAA